ncbi:MAG: sugar transferase [Anaerolineae bacterium]|jgi:lipopolysaccharide/colanic/teichoic acid biosynthesis glycosyltransferase|nr:sugar transferase [Anaerolineae bacterium]
MYKKGGKRALDLVLVSLALVIAAPVLGIVGVLVRAKLGSPVLFRQQRPGLYGRPFTIYKFRTMSDDRDAQGNLLPDTDRLPSFGKHLRNTSLDELPELWNVFRGEMSLVGPRPLLMRYTPYFSDEERQRFSVRPGITGLAQVSGRNDLNWDARLAADVRYVQQYSLRLDLRILFTTLWRVLGREGLQVDPGSVMLDLDAERRIRPN